MKKEAEEFVLSESRLLRWRGLLCELNLEEAVKSASAAETKVAELTASLAAER